MRVKIFNVSTVRFDRHVAPIRATRKNVFRAELWRVIYINLLRISVIKRERDTYARMYLS
jgi:hypothetical protein